MLEHLGRITGARRYAILEVVGHSSPTRYVVVSGFGELAQWFRNVMTNPAWRISCAPAAVRHCDAAERARRLGGADALRRHAPRVPGR